MTNRFVCIHGHFYQPPRENPWLDAIEVQDSAYPYHDWNERINAECYAPNALSRILDEKNRIVRLVNNYSRMSFNFGPTLLSWLEENASDIYFGILEADRASRERFGGHGSALAQAYNHMILPLANDRDRETQVIWGLRDFEQRFGRRAEGMWLPETAVDIPTLETLAAHRVKFTVLSPGQARRVRKIGEEAWQDVGDKVDPRLPYLCRLPSGRSITLFFYDGPASRAVAFERILNSGEAFARRIVALLPDSADRPLLGHIATDGESYGHHHRHGDMALAWALHHLEGRTDVRLTNYAQFLELAPPKEEVEIVERSAWSCAHGVERWRSDCGCNLGGEFHQRWRGPLRDALDWLRDELSPRYEADAAMLFKDPWAARNAYIDVLLDHTPERIDRFLREHATSGLEPGNRQRALKLLELERHAMLMYTSCGWFFDDVSGIETIQVMAYAARTLHLAEELFGHDYEPGLLERLEKAPSNVARYGTARKVYETHVKGSKVDLRWVAAHFAFSSLFESLPDQSRVYAYDVKREEGQTLVAGRAKLAVGRVRVESRLTSETATMTYAVVHLGDHNLHGGVRNVQGANGYRERVEQITQAFEHARLTDVIGLVNEHFTEGTFSVRQLFRDEQRRIVNLVMKNTLEDVEASFRRLYERYLPLLRFLGDLNHPLPKEFRVVGEFVINQGLTRAFHADRVDEERVGRLLDEAQRDGLLLDTEGLAYAYEKYLNRLLRELLAAPREIRRLEAAASGVHLLRRLPFEVNRWRAQNDYYAILQTSYPEQKALMAQGDDLARRWAERFRAMGEELNVHVPT